ncbi:ParB/RepB/Spo0J family partition protein [Thermoflexus sp.]|uniref:ParB/RepB/Spo0J family partition protein n=1 Tax=Thermoflexus sp. TaxID=1969742 RepID=UPI0025CD529E|nr:ParB/RepB/Spo0J family partition protein [Thermoflexus sp.]MCS6964264.1 ParB/RepB/Spo0J family partition protein [Thermoflexus sp.]MCX7690141.1 ParB/RepB/Spo0J family partition protein [Thermoflexus sp.]MDW8183912.1 ParB/RepB/Spo0J family partition protein [Anaerolineae bacterium]
MARKFGLGKGLEALLPAGETTGLLEVPIDAIEPNPHQPRRQIDEADLEGLAQSIREHGLLQPLIVTQIQAEPPRYMLIAGERRWRAAQRAGLTTIPVVVREAAPQQMLELALVENLQRADLNPIEEAQAYRYLIETFGLTHEEVARRVGRSRTTITNALRLLQLPPSIQAHLMEGRITEGHARALLMLSQAAQQELVLRRILEEGLSVRATEELARRLQGQRVPRRKAPARPPGLVEIESRLRQALSTKVRLSAGRRGGRLIIYYYSEEELEALVRRLLRSG